MSALEIESILICIFILHSSYMGSCICRIHLSCTTSRDMGYSRKCPKCKSPPSYFKGYAGP
ncbi:unnamed protein product [Prunus brigantina]